MPPRTPPSRRSPGRRKVALLIETSNAYARGVLNGVVSYIREHEPWSFYLMEQGRGDDPPTWLERWKGDGIIARIESGKIARAVTHSGLPVVDVSAARHLRTIPWVETDDRAIAQLAADHFLARGFQHFAYCGDRRFRWSQWRAIHFRESLARTGSVCEVFEASNDQSDKRIADLEKWLTGLPKPVAVFACYDILGQQILDACRNAGLHVPDQVAVLGVDNDELLCELASPRLSSVIPDARRTGYEAAALLARMMEGERLGGLETRIAPMGLQCRQSTDVFATDDPQLVQAVRFIREHACEAIDVTDVLRVAPLSRKKLDARFKAVLRRTVHDEIVRVRVQRVRQLLIDTDKTLAEIAALAGFQYPEYMSVVFKRETGCAPGAYREQNKSAGGVLR